MHPFDDPDAIAGQGTVALEMLQQHTGPLDAVFVAVGGGGLSEALRVVAAKPLDLPYVRFHQPATPEQAMTGPA